MANSRNTLAKVTINGITQTETIRLSKLDNILDTANLEGIVTAEEISDLKAYIAHKQEQLEKKRSSSKEDGAKKERREYIEAAVLEFLTENVGNWYLTGDIIKKSPKLGVDYSTSAVSNILTKLKDEGKVLNAKDSKGSKYTIAN